MKSLILYRADGEAYEIRSYRDGDPLPAGVLSLVVTGRPKLPGYVADGEYLVRPTVPSPGYVWDAEAKQHVADLEEGRRLAWERAKEVRNQIEFGTFVWNGHVFDGDEQSQVRINLAAMSAQQVLADPDPNWFMAWTLADNSVISLNPSDMIAVMEAKGARTKAAHELGRQWREEIEDAQTLDELEAMTFTPP